MPVIYWRKEREEEQCCSQDIIPSLRGKNNTSISEEEK